MSSNPKGVVIAAPESGSGKTVITMALLRLLRRRGVRVTAAKSGPDYIDPAFHAVASGQPCLNLDAWAMRPATIAATIGRLAESADLILCEGAMGLFDGIDARGTGSSADVAELTGWPVILVVDVGGQSASAAALVRGFARHRPGVHIAGVIFNRVGGKRHALTLDHAVAETSPDIARLGAVLPDARLGLPERHLGLVQARERGDLEEWIESAAECLKDAIDLDALIACARPTSIAATPSAGTPMLPPLGQRIAVAQDDAFAFAYPIMLAQWREAGAELLPFAPLGDEAPAADADAVYLPGGYPELHAGQIAANTKFLDGLRDLAKRVTVYGECGGYMVLGRTLTDGSGHVHRMADLLPVETSFKTRRLALGYRQVRLLGGGPLGAAGTTYRGHEFHYATLVEEGTGAALFDAFDAYDHSLGAVGRRNGGVMGSFIHLIDQGAR